MATEIIKKLKTQNRVLKVIIIFLSVLLLLISIHTGNIKKERIIENDEYG